MTGQARILSQADIKSLFQPLRNSRDQTLFAQKIYSGLRIGEIIAIKQSQVCTAFGGVKNALKVIRLSLGDLAGNFWTPKAVQS